MLTRKLSVLIASSLLAIAWLSPPHGPAASANLFVSGTFTFPDTSIKGFNGVTGEPLTPTGTFASGGGLYFPRGLTFGPDGNMYVASEGSNNVLKYNSTTGEFISEFVAADAGGLYIPKGLAFAPDGKLYVAGYDLPNSRSEVFRFDAGTGAFVDKLSSYVDPMLPPVSFSGPWDVAVGPDENIYFSAQGTINVVRFNPVTHVLSEFVTPTTILGPGTGHPSGLAFGPDGNLYVAIYSVPGRVLKIDGHTGGLLSTFVPTGSGGLSRPDFLTFGPDGNLYVSNGDTNSVLRFSGVDGSPLGTFASLPFPLPFGPGGLAFYVPEPAPWSIALIAIAISACHFGRRR